MRKTLLQRNRKWSKNNLQKHKHGYLIHTWSDRAIKGASVNRALPSLHKGSLWNFAYSPFKGTVHVKWTVLIWKASCSKHDGWFFLYFWKTKMTCWSKKGGTILNRESNVWNQKSLKTTETVPLRKSCLLNPTGLYNLNPLKDLKNIFAKFMQSENFSKSLIYILICFSVRVYPINVKTAKPIGPKFFVGPRVTPGKVCL